MSGSNKGPSDFSSKKSKETKSAPGTSSTTKKAVAAGLITGLGATATFLYSGSKGSPALSTSGRHLREDINFNDTSNASTKTRMRAPAVSEFSSESLAKANVTDKFFNDIDALIAARKAWGTSELQELANLSVQVKSVANAGIDEDDAEYEGEEKSVRRVLKKAVKENSWWATPAVLKYIKDNTNGETSIYILGDVNADGIKTHIYDTYYIDAPVKSAAKGTHRTAQLLSTFKRLGTKMGDIHVYRGAGDKIVDDYLGFPAVQLKVLEKLRDDLKAQASSGDKPLLIIPDMTMMGKNLWNGLFNDSERTPLIMAVLKEIRQYAVVISAVDAHNADSYVMLSDMMPRDGSIISVSRMDVDAKGKYSIPFEQLTQIDPQDPRKGYIPKEGIIYIPTSLQGVGPVELANYDVTLKVDKDENTVALGGAVSMIQAYINELSETGDLDLSTPEGVKKLTQKIMQDCDTMKVSIKGTNKKVEVPVLWFDTLGPRPGATRSPTAKPTAKPKPSKAPTTKRKTGRRR